MSAAFASQQPDLLTSWKEIASYLGKGVRTVQRWEEQFGLPVRRPNEKVKGIVCSTRPELDQWLEAQWSQRPREFARACEADAAFCATVRANMEKAMALRRANRELLADVRSSVRLMIQECQTMGRNLTPTPRTFVDPSET